MQIRYMRVYGVTEPATKGFDNRLVVRPVIQNFRLILDFAFIILIVLFFTFAVAYARVAPRL